jgi:Protein of unknown function (DUF2637)
MSTLTPWCGHGKAGWTGRLVPLTVDGLIYASSMVMLDSARRKTPVPALARWLLGLGVAATLAANVAHGLGDGPVGAVVAAWSAVALVRSYELLMMVIRGCQAAPDGASVARAVRTRFGSGRPRYSPMSWQRTAFLRSARSVLGRTSASPGRGGCESTSRLPHSLVVSAGEAFFSGRLGPGIWRYLLRPLIAAHGAPAMTARFSALAISP